LFIFLDKHYWNDQRKEYAITGYVARNGEKEFGEEASRKGKANHVVFGTMPVASSLVSNTNFKCRKFYLRIFFLRLMFKRP
jgi:hypothetical protein